jgi:hypothetical protein
MELAAPKLEWHDDLIWREDRLACGWIGEAPEWAADRPSPLGVRELLNGRRLELRVLYPEAFPAAPAELFPTNPEVPVDRRTLTQWHVNGDGSLCLMQSADDWQLTDTASDLVRKASCWFIEYLLLEAEAIKNMTVKGIFSDTSLDPVLADFAR